MPPSSGELWGHHLMPSQVDVDCLLPTGIIVILRCCRDATLESVKTDMWKEARKHPLFYLLSSPSSYIFVGITQDAEREEFYDETRRLCDLRLFQAMLKVVEPKGNREEKMLNYDIGIAIGTPVSEFNEIKDLEIMTFRREMLSVSKDAIEEREARGLHGQALYTYPPDVETSADLPIHLARQVEENMSQIIICIWVVSANGDRQKYTVKVHHLAPPEHVIAEAIRKKTRSMHMTAEQQKKCVQEYRDSYLLKICGVEQFLLESYPISQYKYIREKIARFTIPQLMLMSKESVYATLPNNVFSSPSYVMKGMSALQDINNQESVSLWRKEGNLCIKINCATYVNVRDMGKIYVKTGIYHGTEPLCPHRDTKHVEPSNPKWNEWLEYEILLVDLPLSSRLCLSLCSVSRKQKRKVDYALAWGNVNLFDFNSRLQSDKMSLHLWPMPPGYEDLINPIGTPGSNPNKDSMCLEIEFEHFSYPVEFPSKEQMLEYERLLMRQNLDPMSTPYTSPINEKLEIENVEEIFKRDPLSEISEQEKFLLWKLRNHCQRNPDSLPKLLAAVKWNSREDVIQLYHLLKDWPTVSPEVCLELLDCTYTDVVVRNYAVKWLKQDLTDDQLSRFLLQLVQVLKFEPYLDNPLARFLLHKALINQKIGHFLFWHLRSEMHQISIRLRFGLLLEAYCRGCGAYLKSLTRQVESLEKLTKLTDSIKNEKEDDQLKFIMNQVRQADYLEALQNFISPLNNSHFLGELVVERCKVMKSKKKPLMLMWMNPDPMASQVQPDYKLIFKNGDDLRQDMLTLQVIGIMDSIWQSEGLDLRMIPYGCLSTGNNIGMIEVVKNAKTVLAIQKHRSKMAAMQVDGTQLHKWIKERNKESYLAAIDAFSKSCAGYCVATFVLGIGDRHPDNIMVNEEGQVFHIDFGHFLNHRKKKFGYNRERVPFVLTEDFIRVIAKGADNPIKSQEFIEFMELCGKAYVKLRAHSSLFITLFTMMLSCGIPELQSMDDIGYLRKTLAVEKTEQEAVEYFQQQLNEAYSGRWTTKMDWFFHWVKNRR